MFGYIVCGGLYLLLLIASLTLWRRRLTGSALAAVFAIQLAWSGVLAWRASGTDLPIAWLAAAECVRSGFWTWILARWFAGSLNSSFGSRLLVIALAGGIPCGLSVVLSLLAPGQAVKVWLWAGLTLSIGGLIVVEQIARNTRTGYQWRIKYVCLAVGSLFAWDLFVYSSALLQGQAGQLYATLWGARGYVNAIVSVPLMIGMLRIRISQATEFLSPRPVFFNATLLGAVIYMIAIASAGYLIREHAGDWGPVGQAVFLAGAALALLVALLSEQFRAWTRVMVTKYFFPYRYDYREEWQKLTRALSQSDETSVYDRIAAVMARSVNCGTGGLWLRDAEGVLLPAGGELAFPTAPGEDSKSEFFEYLRRMEWIYDLDAARGAVPGEKIPQPPGWMLRNTNLWLVVPLVCDETLVGFVVLSSALAQARLTWEEIDLLRAAGRQVASFLAFEEAAKRLAEARQFEAVNRLSAFLMHDLRHLVAQLALVVQNAARHRGNAAFFDDAIQTIDDSVKRMTRLMDELRTGAALDQRQCVDVPELCREAVRRCSGREPVPTLTLEGPTVAVLANRDALLRMLEHVIRNAQDATPTSGSVAVDLRRSGQKAVINVTDTGTGMDREFIRHRLFRPFNTTKGDRGMGIGAHEVREFITGCGGQVEVESVPGEGTEFTMYLPLAVVSSLQSQPTENELQA